MKALAQGVCFVKRLRAPPAQQTAALGFPEPDDTYILSQKQYLFYIFDTIPILLCFVGE